MGKIDNIGRITIPKDLREQYNLTFGNNYDLVACEGYLKVIPTTKEHTISNEDMTALRKLYIMLSESGILDDFYDEILSRVTEKASMKCDNCNTNLFLTEENTYKCYKCEQALL